MTLAMICAAGAITMLVFHMHLLMSWQGLYSKYPWEGQEGAMAQGIVKPNFAQSTLSFNVARILLLVVAVIVGFLNRRNSVPAGFALWIGAASIAVVTVATDRDAYHGQFGWLAVVLIALLHSFFIFWPVFAGILGGAAVGALASKLKPVAAKQSQTPEPPVSPKVD
jgi:hypothetical protein